MESFPEKKGRQGEEGKRHYAGKAFTGTVRWKKGKNVAHQVMSLIWGAEVNTLLIDKKISLAQKMKKKGRKVRGVTKSFRRKGKEQ